MSNSIPTIGEIEGVVYNLNLEFVEKTDNDELLPFTFSSTGFCTGIKFMGEYIWYTEDDPRDYVVLEDDPQGMHEALIDENGDEMREDLKEFLLNKARSITLDLHQFLVEEEVDER